MLLAPGCLARRLLSPDSGSSNLAGSRLAVHSSGSLARRLLLLLPLRASSNLAGGGQGGW